MHLRRSNKQKTTKRAGLSCISTLIGIAACFDLFDDAITITFPCYVLFGCVKIYMYIYIYIFIYTVQDVFCQAEG